MHDYDPSIPITELENLKNFLVKIGADMSETENSVQRQKQVCIVLKNILLFLFNVICICLRKDGKIIDLSFVRLGS